MKSARKLIPALVMLLVSAIVMSSASFAWFSMNTQVTATNMQVVVKSDNTFLLISGTNSTATEIQNENAIETQLTVLDEDAKVYPSAPVISDTEVTYTAIDKKNIDGDTVIMAGAKVTNEATAALATNWYTASAVNAGAATIKAETAAQLTSAKFSKYVIVKTMYLTVAKGANAANNLKVSAAITQKSTGNDVDACKVLITTSDGGFAVLKNGDPATDIKGSNTALTDSTVLTVKAYIFVDGNDDAIFTNNAVNLTGATVDLTFNVDAVPAA